MTRDRKNKIAVFFIEVLLSFFLESYRLLNPFNNQSTSIPSQPQVEISLTPSARPYIQTARFEAVCLELLRLECRYQTLMFQALEAYCLTMRWVLKWAAREMDAFILSPHAP